MNYSPASPFKSELVLDQNCKMNINKAKTHWDATAIYRLTVKQSHVIHLPTDPRPWTKICMSYVNSGAAEVAPEPPANMVFPSGGAFYPPSRYSSAINDESLLRRLDRPLNNDLLTTMNKSCGSNQYFVPLKSDIYNQSPIIPFDNNLEGDISGRASVLPKSDMYLAKVVNSIASGTESPSLLTMSGENHCRRDSLQINSHEANWSWNNPTKQNKYNKK